MIAFFAGVERDESCFVLFFVWAERDESRPYGWRMATDLYFTNAFIFVFRNGMAWAVGAWFITFLIPQIYFV